MATRVEWAKRVERWEKSGLSAEAFGARERLKAKQLYWWRWRLRSSPAVTSSSPMMSSSSPPPLRFLPVEVKDGTSAPVGAAVALEIALPNGRVVRVPPGYDPAMLERVLVIASEGGRC
jgi:transposase